MKKHTKIYLDFFNYKIPEDVQCEVCHRPAVDINHIECRGMGGSKLKDYIENLMGTCRECHELYGDKEQYKEMLKEKHLEFIKLNGK